MSGFRQTYYYYYHATLSHCGLNKQTRLAMNISLQGKKWCHLPAFAQQSVRIVTVTTKLYTCTYPT